jgi:hypothetical protein
MSFGKIAGLLWLLPDPEVLKKYGNISLEMLHGLRCKAREKGKEHRDYMEKRIQWN